MGQKQVIGPISKGLKTNLEPFYIDNDSFPLLENAYQWRGRVKRKRGTSLLNRMQRYFNSANASYFALTRVVITGATQASSCVITATNSFVVGQTVTISAVGGMTQLNGNTYTITAATGSQFTINVNSTGFGAYTSGGLATLASEIITLDSGGNGNLIDGFGLEENGDIIPGSVTINSATTGNTYTDTPKNGTLVMGVTVEGTINYATGAIVLAGEASNPITASFQYYPALPVMGLEDLNLNASQFPKNVGFDTTYAYNVSTSSPYPIYSVSFYKNPAINSTTMPGYVAKTNPTPLRWNGLDYQQFWSTNYENALFSTNGIQVPFSTSNIGMQFKPIVKATIVAGGPPAKVSLNIVAHGLVVGDFVYLNEIQNITGINYQTGYVITVTDANNVVVELPDATLASATTAVITGATQANPAVLTSTNTFSIGESILISGVVGMTQLNGNVYVVSAGSTTSHITLNVDSTGFGAYVSGGVATLATGTGGIAQYLTSTAVPGVDCIRWYDGDPTNGVINNPTLNQPNGWVNFMPPISELSFSIGDLPPAQYYLVGARAMLPFKDRILFFGAVVQSSTTGPFYLQDTIVYSQNGTPYYTCSFTGSVTSAATEYFPLLTPTDQTTTQSAAANTFFSDVEGYGGFITAGFAQPITTVAPNQDVIMVGFTSRKTKVVYTGNDLVPFNFYIVNSELGDSSTFSVIVLDRGNYAIGDHGITIANQVQAERIDIELPDQVFQINLTGNGAQRVTAQRDFINEWVYFTYNSNESQAEFPNQTLLYNYRDDSWGIFNESYTTYGQIRRVSGDTWATIGQKYPTWSVWNVPWNAGSSTLLQPEVIAGNQQGFVMLREDGTGEGPSLSIEDLTFPETITGITQATEAVVTVNNNFIAGQLVMITGVVGMTQVNGNTYEILSATPTSVTLDVDSSGFSAYISGGTITPTNTIYSPNHGLSNGDYIVINGCLGTIASQVNGNIFSVYGVDPAGTGDLNSFSIDPGLTPGTYLGNGTITRMYIPKIQTKQFPIAWDLGRKTRIGPQQYLFSTTANGQVELQIFLSQDAANAYNAGSIVPQPASQNNALIYTDTLFTSPAYEIVNCFNSSLGLIGNGSSTSYTLSYQALFGFATPLVQGSISISIGNVATFQDNGLGGFTATGTGTASGSSVNYGTGVVVLAFTSAPTSEPSTTTFQYNQNTVLNPTAAQQAQLWQRMNTSLLGDTVQLGFTLNDAQMRNPYFQNQFAEIELHSIILDLTPAGMLA